MTQQDPTENPQATLLRSRSFGGALALGGALCLFTAVGHADAPAGRYTIAAGTSRTTRPG